MRLKNGTPLAVVAANCNTSLKYIHDHYYHFRSDENIEQLMKGREKFIKPARGDLSWIDENDYVPSLLFHGTSDPVVPFARGLPFTLLITLPVVHGSSVISERLSLHNISHQLVAEEGELHEYWGAVNGNFIGGEPSIYWDSILNTGFQFLYNQFSKEFNCDINFDGSINILDVVMLVNIILGLEESSYQFDLNSDNLFL